SVTLNETTESSTTNAITFQEPNGTYSYSIGSINGYTASPPSGIITVKGANVTQTITFTSNSTKTYIITFTETGLPSGASWSVTLNGITKTSSTNTITFNETYGTYTYTITIPNGYETSQSSGTITTTQSSTSIPVVVSLKSTSITTVPPSQTGSIEYLLIGIIAMIFVIAIIAGIIFMRRGKSKKTPKEWKEPPKQ
ncbi:MAG: hypothetical protein ACP5SF_04370, partial [Thermoplasmata archaeon]